MKQDNTNSTPLWRELNERRTQGKWDNNLHDGNVNCEGMVVANCHSSFLGPKTIKANAMFVSLAVNNFAPLAEAVESLLAAFIEHGDKDLNDLPVDKVVDLLEKALAAIS